MSTNFGIKENWDPKSFPHHVAMQEEMIKRKYPDYTKDKWVLWIVPDFFHKYIYEKITGSIQIIKKDGTKVELQSIVRKPYYNKHIHQISMTMGRKRLYGIPLVYDSFEELSEISQVLIRWDVYFYSKLGKANIPEVNTLVTNYILSFEKDESNKNYHYYTLATQSNACVSKNTYCNDFDIALLVPGSLLKAEEDKYVSVFNIADVFYPKDTFENVVPECPINERERYIFDEICSDKYLPDPTYLNEFKDNIRHSPFEIQYSVWFYEKNTIMLPTEAADILTEPGFGFKEI